MPDRNPMGTVLQLSVPQIKSPLQSSLVSQSPAFSSHGDDGVQQSHDANVPTEQF